MNAVMDLGTPANIAVIGELVRAEVGGFITPPSIGSSKPRSDSVFITQAKAAGWDARQVRLETVVGGPCLIVG